MSLDAFVDEIRKRGLELHAFCIVKQGRVIAEAACPPYRLEVRHAVHSLTKGFTALGVLFAVQEGLLGLDDPVSTILSLPEPILSPSGRALTLRHLLTMTAGRAADPTENIVGEPDWILALCRRPLDQEPGKTFVYDNSASHLASACLQAATRQSLRDWLLPRCFEPLGILDPLWDTDPQGRSFGASGLYLTVGEVARLGQLLLQKGQWQGQQLLDARLVEEAVRVHVETTTQADPDSRLGYGFQLWRGPVDGYRAQGAFGQLCIVFPDQEMVVATLAGVRNPRRLMEIIGRHLVNTNKPPAVESGPAPTDGWRCDPPGEPVSDGIVPKGFESWSGTSWDLVDHPRGWTRLEFSQAEGAQFCYHDDRGCHTVPFGWASWRVSRSRAWRHESQQNRIFETFASASLTSPEELSVTLRFSEQALTVTLTFFREGNRLRVEQSVAPSFRSQPSVTIWGHLDSAPAVQ